MLVLLALPALVAANPVPDAMVFFNVRPAGPPEERCVTDITSCEQMHASTPAQGPVEFQIFLHPLAAIGDGTPLYDMWTYLTWPSSWTLLDACFNTDHSEWYPEGSHDAYLGLGWDCLVPDRMFLAATLVFDVQEFGRLDASGDCQLWIGCPTQTNIYPSAHFGEAGAGCEYTDFACARTEYHCVPILTGLQVQLTAPAGGAGHAELQFPITGYPYPICDFTVHSNEPWATGYVESHEYSHGTLYVDADASGLTPGVYEAEMQLVYERTGGWGTLARCLPVILTVEPASSVEGSDPAALPLGLRLTSASPSSGPFVFAYGNPAPAHVRCGVFDAAGREVAPLLELAQPAGRRTVTWGATDAEGRRVRPGVYLVRLALDGQVRSTRVVVVR